jgi:hypothetical protein
MYSLVHWSDSELCRPSSSQLADYASARDSTLAAVHLVPATSAPRELQHQRELAVLAAITPAPSPGNLASYRRTELLLVIRSHDDQLWRLWNKWNPGRSLTHPILKAAGYTWGTEQPLRSSFDRTVVSELGPETDSTCHSTYQPQGHFTDSSSGSISTSPSSAASSLPYTNGAGYPTNHYTTIPSVPSVPGAVIQPQAFVPSFNAGTRVPSMYVTLAWCYPECTSPAIGRCSYANMCLTDKTGLPRVCSRLLDLTLRTQQIVRRTLQQRRLR